MEKSKDNELKPCPFCGNIPTIKSSHNFGFGFDEMEESFYIDCYGPNCHMIVESGYYDTKQKAIDAWNTRKGE